MAKAKKKNSSKLDYGKLLESVSWITLMKAIGIMFLVFFGTYGGFHYFNQMFGYPDDNYIEQQIENMIENQTGIDIDLTPSDY